MMPVPSCDVSVVVPAFRAARFIARAIDSALCQQGVTVEVLVVDDACPQRTGDAVAARYGGCDAVRVIRLAENRGPAGARNAGFAAARGGWIAVLDADDAFAPGRLARMVEQAMRRDADVIADNVRFHDARSGALGPPAIPSLVAPQWIDLHTLAAKARPGTGELDYGMLKPLFRRAFVANMSELYPPEVRHGEDFRFYLRLLKAGARFLLVPEPGYLWTQRNSGQSQTREDYLGQAEDTRAMARRERAAGDAQLAAILDQRARALVRLHRERRFDAVLHRRDFAGAISALLRHPALAPRLARRMLARVRS